MLRLLLAVCALSACVHAKITHRHISADERDHFRVELPFGFDSNGVIKLEVKNVVAYGPYENATIDRSRFGFFLATPESEAQVATDYMQNLCYLDDQHLIKLLDFTQWDGEDQPEIRAELYFRDNGALVPGEYALYYAACDEATGLSFDVRIEFYSEDVNGHRDYLSVGERPLPTIYMIMFLTFSALSITWAKICFDQRRYVHGIHYLMFALVVLRSVVYFTQAGMYHEDRVTGSPEGWNVAYYVFTFFRGVMFFVVIVLIGTGWSYLRPFIGENEKKILVVVIPLQVFANIAIIVLDETSPVRTSFVTLTDLFHLVDIICCCAILFPIVWSIKHLREGAESDGKAAVNVEKLTLFRQFYVLVVVYIYFTRIIVYLLDNTLPYDYKWASILAMELATLAFYVTVGRKFSPHGENLYLKLESEASL